MRLATNLAAALTASFLILATSPAALASTHETTADLAEQSRMLAPRATKAYLMVQQGINPEAGRRLLAESVSRLDQNLAALRRSAIPFLRRHFGLIFQDQKLLFDRSVLDNVLLPLAIVGAPHKEALRRARAALDKVGLLEREKAHPIALSGGEQQRLAIARAVVNRPAILLADEPTANLDADSASDILAIFRAFHQVGVTLVVATHDPQWMARFSPRVLRLERGQLVSDSGDSA